VEFGTACAEGLRDKGSITPLSPGPSPTRGEGSKQPGTVMEGGKPPSALGEGCPTPSPLVGEGWGEGVVRPGRPVGHMGYHRRVRYLDVVTNKKRIDAERGKALNALAEQTQALKMR